MTKPTDEEIRELWEQYKASLPRFLCFARAVLEKWGAAPQQAAPAERKSPRTITYVCPVCAASLERLE